MRMARFARAMRVLVSRRVSARQYMYPRLFPLSAAKSKGGPSTPILWIYAQGERPGKSARTSQVSVCMAMT
ncbi:hypothetical protein B1991_02985 [Rhodanobacter lindaniclasticus]|uniref:Uncharacterized protein n=1 Tax=Rhodanobacter lindaniclasticus TaxID=75310 RepID=A0A4S3KMG6_9GAMM|nr:hypothetical protein B1991_02985 [Rhodanobacter lindaniclasticus]